MVKKDLVAAKLAELAARAARVRAKCPASAQALAADPDALDIVSFNLMLAVQLCADIAAHVTTDERWLPAKSLAEGFTREVIYSTNDDYSGEVMTGPTLPAEFTRVVFAPVVIGRHVVVGAGSIVLPGISIGEGAATGALSLIKDDVAPFTIVAGNPARVIGARARQLLDLEQEYLRADR